jgi:hypoxanthine phosphoribosyltransferase
LLPVTALASVLIARQDIRRRVGELARTITGDYVGREPVLVTVLKGGAMFLADLTREIDLPLETHFIAISRYGQADESMGHVRLLLDVDVDIADRDVILVEDIVDTGLTSRYLLSVLGSRGPASLELCAFLDRRVRRIVPLEPRYSGFECPDRFVIGYGLDFRERYRNLPDVLEIEDTAALAEDPDALMPLLAGSGAA